MKVEAADPKVSGELLFPPPYGIIGIVIRFKSSVRRSTTLAPRLGRAQTGKGARKKKKKKINIEGVASNGASRSN